MPLFKLRIAADREPLPDDIRFAPSKHVFSANQGDYVILLELRRGNYFTLNSVGTRVWELLVEGKSSRVISEVIAGEYEVPVGRVVTDVSTLLGALQKQRLIVKQE